MLVIGEVLLLARETILSFYFLVKLVVTYLCTLHSFKNIPHCISKGVTQYSTQLLV